VKAPGSRQRGQLLIELLLAEIAATGGVGRIVGVLELISRNLDQVQVECPGYVERLFVLGRAERGADPYRRD